MTEIALSDIACEVRDLYHPRNIESLPYVGLKHIQPNLLHLLGIGNSSETQSAKKKFRRGDLLFGTLRPYLRKVVWAKIDGVCSTDITVIRAKEPSDTGFLFYLMASPNFIDYATATSTGTNLPRAKWSVLSEMDWQIPVQGKRGKIGAILSNYDDLIENNTRRIKILEGMAGTICREWFVEFQFPGHENGEMVESELGLIPQGWEIVKLSDIVELTRKGITPSIFPKETFAHFSIPAFDNGGLPTLDTGDTIKSSKYVVPPDCVLMSKLNPQIPRVWLPFINIVHRPIASTEFLIIKPKPPVDCMYLFHLYQSPEFSHEFSVQRLGTSRSHQRVSSEGFLGMSVLLPNKSFLNEFHEKVNPIVNLCNTLRLKNTNLRQTRDVLLPKLISGEFDVSDLDIGADLYCSQEGEKSYAA